jgi:succinoglycan biosynthesis transport protein ExoP
MKPGDVIYALRRRYWIIIALVLISALTGAIVSIVQTPVYKVMIVMAAEAPNSPTTKNPDPTVTFAMAASMQAIMNAAQSIDVATATSSRLKEGGINLSPADLQDKVTASFEANTTSLSIEVTDSSPTRVVEIANTWGEEASRLLSNKSILMGGNLVLTNRAFPPKGPTMPNSFAYIGLGVFLGLVLGVSLAIGLEYFDPHFRSSEEAEELLGLPVLGALPREHTLSPQGISAYANIRTNLLLSREEQEYRSILVAPVIPDFEKTQANLGARVTAQLAMSIAKTGRRTLLVDCDMNEGAVSGLLGAIGLAGLADALEESQPLEKLIAGTDTTGLYVLPTGSKPGIPADLLSSPVLPKFLRDLEDEYDAVVLDGPPLIVSMDSAIVAKSAGSSLLVIDVRNCTRSSALEALDNFDRFQIKPTGVILTNVKPKRS